MEPIDLIIIVLGLIMTLTITNHLSDKNRCENVNGIMVRSTFKNICVDKSVVKEIE